MYKREYHYFLSERGRLYHLIDPAPFLDRGKLPCGPAFLSNPKFLHFFFTHLRRTPAAAPLATRFPYVSQCGLEANYLACDDAPVVFNELALRDDAGNKGGDAADGTFTFASALNQEFTSSRLRTANGRLYHPVDHLPKLSTMAPIPRSFKPPGSLDPSLLERPVPSPFVAAAAGEEPVVYGLLDSNLAITLGFGFIDDVAEDTFEITLFGNSRIIPPLPPEAPYSPR
jgi:hypothetical protein